MLRLFLFSGWSNLFQPGKENKKQSLYDSQFIQKYILDCAADNGNSYTAPNIVSALAIGTC